MGTGPGGPRELEDPDYLGRPFPRSRSYQISRRAPGCAGLFVVGLACVALFAGSIRACNPITAVLAAAVFVASIVGGVSLPRGAMRAEIERDESGLRYR